jgi:hypothetical protein
MKELITVKELLEMGGLNHLLKLFEEENIDMDTLMEMKKGEFTES